MGDHERPENAYPKRKTSTRGPGHRIYPYLLRGLAITRPNQVWCSDVTYIPMARGFCYLVAIMDWATRAVLAFRLATTMEADSCVEALGLNPTPGETKKLIV